MPFWQIAGLIVLVTAAGAGLMVLRAVLARAAAALPPNLAPATPPELADLATVRAEWRAYQKHLDAYLEAFTDMEEAVEHKRRRTSAAASKLKAAEEEQAPESADPRAGLFARARQQGLPV